MRLGGGRLWAAPSFKSSCISPRLCRTAVFPRTSRTSITSASSLPSRRNHYSDMSKGNTNSALPPLPVPWGRLRAWVDEQELAEREGNEAARMSRAQFAALSHFVEFIRDPEPDASEGDYVSQLMHIIHIRKSSPPVYIDLEPIDVPVDGNFMQRWRTVCYLPSSGNKQFPCIGYGVREGNQGAPMFKSKKVAKQYAAKQAVEFLNGEPPDTTISSPNSPSPGGASLRTAFSPISQNPGPSNTISNSPARQHAPSSPAPPALAGGSNSNSNSNSDNSKSNNNVNINASPPVIKRQPSDALMTYDPPQFYNEEGPSVVTRVTELAVELGLGSPRYVILPDGESTDLYSGTAEFKDGGRVPPGLGTVSGVMGKKKTKQMMAEIILEWMLGEKKRRQADFEDLFDEKGSL